MDYFGLWISGNYGRGHSKARPQCSTYNSPCLSSEEEFAIDLLEVWGAGPPKLPENEVGYHGDVVTRVATVMYVGPGTEHIGQR